MAVRRPFVSQISFLLFATLHLQLVVFLSHCGRVVESVACNKPPVDNLPEFPSVTVLKSNQVGINTVWKEKRYNGSSILFIPSNGTGQIENLELVCSASYPVQWSFVRFQKWVPWTVTTGREEMPFQGKDVFRAWLRYPLMRNITQIRNDFPTCHKTTDECVQTSVSVSLDKKALLVRQGTSLELNPDAQFGKNVGCKLRIAYDEKNDIFYCHSLEPNVTITMFPVQCSDPVDCRSVYMESEEPCSQEDVIPYEKCPECAKLSYSASFVPSAAVCLVRGLPDDATLNASVSVPFLYSLTKNSSISTPTKYLNWADIEPLEMVEVTKFNKSFYAGETIVVTCNMSYYYFGSGIQIEAHRVIMDNATVAGIGNDDNITSDNEETDLLSEEDFESISISKNSEIIIDERTTRNGAESMTPSIRSVSANIVTRHAGLYKITCRAPVWNTTEWVSKSTAVFILASASPKFLSGNKTEQRFYQPEMKLECSASGIPKPTLEWSLDGRSLPPTVTVSQIEENGTQSWSSVKFPNSPIGVYGNFTCTASNAAGDNERLIMIIPSDKSSTTAIYTMVFLGFMGMILIPTVVYLIWKVRQQKKQLRYLTQEEVEEFLLGKPDFIPFESDMSTYAYYLPYDKNYEIAKDDLEIDFSKILGSGAYGMVIFGIYKVPGSEDRKNVAVKTSKPMDDGIDLFKALLSELKIMTYIGEHENIVNLIGACTQNIQKREVFIALEFCENGNLLSYLRTNRHSFLNPVFNSDTGKSPVSRQPSFLNQPQVQYVKMEDLTQIAFCNPSDYANIHRLVTMDLLRWAHEIAEGMHYLSIKKVIHGDLAARNVLLTSNLQAKIGDFGLSKRLMHYNSYTRTATTPLPIKWLALECLQDFQFSAESDIWSYGITLWEIFSLGEIPYSGFNGTGEEFLNQLSRGMRLSQPTYCTPEIFDVMMSCWRHNRKQRPTFDVLSYYFKKHTSTPAITELSHPLVALRLSAVLRSMNESKELSE